MVTISAVVFCGNDVPKYAAIKVGCSLQRSTNIVDVFFLVDLDKQIIANNETKHELKQRYKYTNNAQWSKQVNKIMENPPFIGCW